MACARSGWIASWVGLCVLSISGFGRAGTLVLSPQKALAEPGKWTLLPPESAMIDGDAVPLYEKAAQALPDKAGDEQIRKWAAMPIEQLPLDQVEDALSKYTESLKAAARAAKCRQSNWPEYTPGMEVKYLEEYRRIAFAVRLWARLEIANEGYDGAILALQTAFGMSRHIGQAPTIIQVLVGTSIGGVACRQVAEFVQGVDAPNLYPALASLPRPFVQMEKALETERKAAGPQGVLEGSNAALDRFRLITTRLDRDLAALQCVEAIRSYAASHGGKLPASLADITEVSVPGDPTNNGEPFRYAATGSTAILESFLPPGGSEKEQVRYEISVKGR